MQRSRAAAGFAACCLVAASRCPAACATGAACDAVVRPIEEPLAEEVSLLQSKLDVLASVPALSLERQEGLEDALQQGAEGNPAMTSWLPLRRVPTDPRVVVSLSTVPAGVAGLGPTLRSLQQQRLPADAIELNLPLRSARGLGDYPELAAEDIEGVSVYRTEDWLALTNLIPTVQRARARAQVGGGETLILVVDDDKVYPPSLIEDHLRAFRARPLAAGTCRGYRVPPGGDLSTAVFWPAWDELFHSTYGHQLEHAERVAVVTGSDSWSVAASLVPTGLWTELDAKSPADKRSIRQAAGLMNDVWVSGQLSRAGVAKFAVPCRYEAQGLHKGLERERQNLQNERAELNSRVMKFFLKDWQPEEIMPAEELSRVPWQAAERHDLGTEPPELPFLSWAWRRAATGFSSVFLGL